MSRKKVVDSAKLVKAVESGQPAKVIMTEFGISTRIQLKSYYLDALIESGKAKNIMSRTPKAGGDGASTNVIKVNKRGSLVIPQKMVEELGYILDDSFSIRRTKSGISLRKN